LRDPGHRDTNYGVVFSVWDRLVGTQHPDDGVYPETGIDDLRFPDEWTSEGAGPLRAPLGHFLYPFHTLAAARCVPPSSCDSPCGRRGKIEG
jgi:sterol desaturase/sphingolipid hydroxylase (fatty acid hydroxylase superfamily)